MSSARGLAMHPAAAERYRRIYAAVAEIPYGRVSSYGAVARRAGLARGARLAGRALADCGDDVPWHRVVNAAGRIALPLESATAAEQLQRLRAEGVAVRDGRVDPRFFVEPADLLDVLLWGPGRSHLNRPSPARRRGP